MPQRHERITTPKVLGFHSDRLISALFSCAFSQVSRFWRRNT